MNKNNEISIVPADQIPPSEKSEPPTSSPISSKGVFVMRAKGQSFEEFKEAIIQKFKDAGLTDE